jgi:protoheme IX farnesyltransferase
MLSMGAWVLYGLVFLWQFPHFMAIAWMYRGDYERAGYLVLPHGRRRDSVMGLQAVLPSLGLIALSFATVLLGKHGLIYAAGAMMFSSCFLYYGAQLVISKTNDAARRLLFASILYLPAMFVVMMMDRI